MEDDDETRSAYVDRLLAAGYEVVAARDGREALDYLAHSTPSLVLLDIVLPKNNGYDVLEKLRSDGRLALVPVVVVSGVPYTKRLGGAVAYLRKPVDPVALLRTVREWCGDPRRQQNG